MFNFSPTDTYGAHCCLQLIRRPFSECSELRHHLCLYCELSAIRGQFMSGGFFCLVASLVEFNQCPTLWWVGKVTTLCLGTRCKSAAVGSLWCKPQVTSQTEIQNPEWGDVKSQWHAFVVDDSCCELRILVSNKTVTSPWIHRRMRPGRSKVANSSVQAQRADPMSAWGNASGSRTQEHH